MLLAPSCDVQLTGVKSAKWENVSDTKAPLLVSYTLSRSTLHTQSLQGLLKKKKKAKQNSASLCRHKVPLKHALG